MPPQFPKQRGHWAIGGSLALVCRAPARGKGRPRVYSGFPGDVRQQPGAHARQYLAGAGFFHEARAYQPLFDNLHSAQVTDRMNAILGLKNLGGKEVIPALLVALDDPDVQVRQVANFALEGLTSHKVVVSDNSSGEESRASRATGTLGGANAPAAFYHRGLTHVMIGDGETSCVDLGKRAEWLVELNAWLCQLSSH